MSRMEMLSESQFFRQTPLDILRLLEPMAQDRDFAPGVEIFAEGQHHSEIHIVSSGHVRLEMQIPGRGRTPILSTGPGDLLGWSPLLGDSAMTATAITLDTVRTLAFPASELRQLCEVNHDIGYYFMKRLASAMTQRLTATRLQLLDLYQVHAPATGVMFAKERPVADEG